ncbi:MAG: DUF5710 domain-containing protein [Lachnospiraceae bacterium]|nr:DUF5710 domain-containing protein [Lachnospiraceae bacterium]
MGIDWEDMYGFEDYDPCDYDMAYDDAVDDWDRYCFDKSYKNYYSDNRDTTRHYIYCPYSEKEIAKKRGARWDPVKKLWYYEGWKDPNLFSRWKPVQ